MDINKIKIVIAVVLILAALGVAYMLDFSKWKEIANTDTQISQVKAMIQAKQNYYSVMDSKLQALNDAGWATKKDSIMINFDSSLFFTPKINNFFNTIVSSSGMKLVSMTSSAQESIKGKAQAAAVKTENGAEISQTETPSQTVQPTVDYFNRLQADVKRTTVNLTVSGTYNGFKNLLNLFANQTRIVTVKSVSVASNAQGEGAKTVSGDLSFSVILDVYSY